MLQTKKLRSKSWKTRVFFTFRLPILDGRVHEQVSSVLFFYSVFWRRASRPIKNRRFWPKNAPPPPGKPVTFYECHPEDHAPAPSVRADFSNFARYTIEIWCFFRLWGLNLPVISCGYDWWWIAATHFVTTLGVVGFDGPKTGEHYLIENNNINQNK